LSDEAVKKVLRDFGLTEKEAEIYLFLAKHGALRGGEVAKGIRTDKAEVYRILKSLQAKNLVESTLEAPTRFTTVPFETVLDSFIKAKREEALLIEHAKQDLLNDWKNISKSRLALPLEKFTVIKGNNKIYPKILQMVKDAKNSLSVISTVHGLARADRFGIFDSAFVHPLKDKLQFRFLTELSEQNVLAMKTLLARIPKSEFDFKGKNPNLGLQPGPRMVIRDDEEILFFITPKLDAAAAEQDEVCLWTNCKALVQAFTAVFEESWSNSTDIENTIAEVETGKSTPKTHVITDSKIAQKTYEETVQSAKEEIMMLTSAKGLLASWKDMASLKERAGRGVSIKIMAPIVKENFMAAQQLAECCEVKHAPVSYLRTTLVDGKYLFQFNNPQTDPKRPEAQLLPFENTFYTNDREYVEKTKAMLDDIWKRAHAPSAVPLETIINPPIAKAASIPEGTRFSEYRKLSSLVEASMPEMMTERDILNKIMNAPKPPATGAFAKHTDTFYGSTGTTIIHPPSYFNLPDMILGVYHWNKQSSHGAEDMLAISLKLETPIGHKYVPVAIVMDNPRVVAHRRAVAAGTPAGENVILVKKDELQVRVHGNTLFAGWTVPIPLFPPPYTLPPCCILFEGYGDLKTSVLKTRALSGRTQIREGNYFEAFVTFFHPSSKYAGPGTDGIFGRDVIMTTYPPPSQNK